MASPVKNVRRPDPETPKRPPGHPRKNQLDSVSKSEESVNNKNAIAKVLRLCMKKHNKMVSTVNNGFEPGLKPAGILAALKQMSK